MVVLRLCGQILPVWTNTETYEWGGPDIWVRWAWLSCAFCRMANLTCVHIICTKWPVDALVRQEAHARSKPEAGGQLSRSTLKRKGPLQTKASSEQGSVWWATASEGIVYIESQMALTQEQSPSFLFMFAALIDRNKVRKERLGSSLWPSHIRGADSLGWGATV